MSIWTFYVIPMTDHRGSSDFFDRHQKNKRKKIPPKLLLTFFFKLKF
jgi:hypothetical protein